MSMSSLIMKRLSCRSIAALLIMLGSVQSALALDVYIVAGQSNGWRISHLAAGKKEQPDAHRVYYYGMKCVSEPDRSEIQIFDSLDRGTMGFALADQLRQLSDDDIIFIQFCRCGAGLWNKKVNGWYPGDDPQNGQTHDTALYGKFLKYLRHARRSATEQHGLKWNVCGLFWHQGEGDSGRDAAAYERDLRNLFWRFRHDLGEELPIVAAHIRQLDEGDRGVNQVLDRLAGADERLAVVPSGDLKFEPDRNGKPNVHFALEGCHELGRRMAAAHRKLRQ